MYVCNDLSLFLSSSFDFAFEIAKVGLKSKLPDIHMKYALYLEDEVHKKTHPNINKPHPF